VDGTHPKLEAVREGTSSLVMRGTTAIADVEDMLGVQFGETADETVTTIAGLLSHVSGKVPPPGDKFDLQGFRFEVLEANQRKVLRVRIQKLSETPMGKA
jgi:CBS domain containing-hemolysin-like protein